MRGELPAELGSLTDLRQLALWSNELTGAIPPELDNLTMMENFAVGGNQLSGEIPAWPANFKNLRELHLPSNRFTGPVPRWVGQLPLSRLLIGNNRLSGEIPSELRNLSNLQSFWLGGNELTGCIPADLRHVQDNDFANSGLSFCAQAAPTPTPTTPRPTAAIRTPIATPTPAPTAAPTAAPAPIATPTPLPPPRSDEDREVLIAFYHATDGLNWKNDANWLSDAPIEQWHGVSIDENGRVSAIDLHDNGLGGHLPPELGSLDALSKLALDRNKLAGTLPPELANLRRLQAFDLGGSQLTGALPSWLAELPNLNYLSLWGNRFTGDIPGSLGKMSALGTLDVRSNELTGPIPPELAHLTNLEMLLLSYNQLSGAIPLWPADLPKLTRLELEGNRLSGTVPVLFGQRTREALELLPWVRDGLDSRERSDYDGLVDLTEEYPLGVATALGQDWLDDGVSRLEFSLTESLGKLSPDAAAAIADMPFLEVVDPADPNAVTALANLERLETDGFHRIMAHPTLADGFDNDEAKIVTLMYGTYKFRRELVEPLLSKTGIYREERTIQLPLAGETVLVIFRVQDQQNKLMDYLEATLRYTEEIVGEPFPTNYVAVLLAQQHPDDEPEGVWHGTHFTVSIWYEEGYWKNGGSGEFFAQVFAHELAHYYFAAWTPDGMRAWINEGAAQFLGNNLWEHLRTGRKLAPTNNPCRSAKTIAELDAREIFQPATLGDRRADEANTAEGGTDDVDDRWFRKGIMSDFNNPPASYSFVDRVDGTVPAPLVPVENLGEGHHALAPSALVDRWEVSLVPGLALEERPCQLLGSGVGSGRQRTYRRSAPRLLLAWHRGPPTGCGRIPACAVLAHAHYTGLGLRPAGAEVDRNLEVWLF